MPVSPRLLGGGDCGKGVPYANRSASIGGVKEAEPAPDPKGVWFSAMASESVCQGIEDTTGVAVGGRLGVGAAKSAI